MTSKHTKGKVRDFELTLEDAGRLADCLNSFDDSDSWPGGFTHGNPFTAERVLKDWKKQDNLRVIVAFKDDKIVGHCNVVQGDLDPEAAYVGLLGADPAYQGQGFGKAMLIEAAEAAANAGKRRVYLHTWAGNLKAMPLYKRVGYNWVPGTRVLMESHIPGILNCEMFEEFFSRYYWYDAYTREIHQEVDDVTEGPLGVFKYLFEGENGDSLKVTIDREARGICGFELTLDGNTLEVDVRPESHHGYIGIGEVPVELRISNKGNQELTYTIQVAPAEGFSVDLQGVTSGNISVGESVVLEATYSISVGTEPLDREVNPDEQVKTQATWTLGIGENTMRMFSGLVSKDAIVIASGPNYPSISPGESARFAISLRNNSEQSVKGIATFNSLDGHELSKTEHSFSLNPNEATEVGLEFSTTYEDENIIVPIEISVSVEEESQLILLARKPLDIPVIGPVGALAYRGLDETVLLETERFRITMSRNPPMMMRYIENKITGMSEKVWWFLPMPGYPFPSEGGEWGHKKFDLQVRNFKDRAEIQLEAESVDRPGLRMTIIYRAHPGREYMETMVRLANVGTTKQTDLGLMMGLWMDYLGGLLHVPVKGDIYCLDSVEWTGQRQLPKSPKYYHESWAAQLDHDGVSILGTIWNTEHLEEVTPTRIWSTTRTEYRLPDLEVGQSIEIIPLRLVVTQGSWKNVRRLWAQLNSKSAELKGHIEVRSDLEVELIHTSSKTRQRKGAPIIVDRAIENKMQLRVSVIHEDAIKSEIVLKMPEGLLANSKRKLEFNVESLSVDSPFIVPITITVDDDKDWLRRNGEVELKFQSRIARIPLTALVYDSKVPTKRDTTTEQNRVLHSLTLGEYQMAVSPDYCANLVRLGKEGKPSVFYDTFPEAKPFMWWDQHYGGVSPMIAGWDIWDWESALPKEKWLLSEVTQGPWIGHELRTVAKHAPKVKDIEFTVRHMMLPGVPIVHSEIRATNRSGQWRKVWLGFRGIPRVGGKTQSNIHTVTQGGLVSYSPTADEARIAATPEEGWIAFEEPESGEVLGTISGAKKEPVLRAMNLGEKAQETMVQGWKKLKSGESGAVSCYYVLTSTVEDVVLLKNLPARIE